MAWIVGTPFNDDGLFGTAFDDIIWGLEGNDSLYGGAGNDQLEGGLGADVMAGGTGNDTYYVDNVGDVVFEFGGQGTDTVRSSIGYTLASGVENLVLTGAAIRGDGNELNNQITGTAGTNNLSGGGGNDTLWAGGGNDTLKGGGGSDILDGGSGVDTMIGGLGADTYYVDNIADVVIETANDAYDTVYSSVTFTLTDFVDNLVLTGTAINGTGNSGDNGIIGNAANNVLSGGAGFDRLDGGLGADTMIGGTGGDSYIIDNVGDVVVENAGEGHDIVYSYITHTLGDNFELLNLLGSAHVDGTGNALDNWLLGNNGNNVLAGLGGNDLLAGYGGTDTLIGGTGDDWFIYVEAGDVLVENAGEGIDSVEAYFSYTLGANFENLYLSGTGNQGTGNDLDNEIYGNHNFDDVLRGLGGNDTFTGGLGSDTLIGGTGDDIYVFRYDESLSFSAEDLVIENAGEGTDRVFTAFDYTLTANVEALFISDDFFTGDVNGTGNDLNNLIEGNSKANTLDGGLGADDLFGHDGNDTLFGKAGGDRLEGGTGNDVLIGGAGADVQVGGAGVDRFFVETISDSVAGSEDQIVDFSAAESDKVDVSAIDADIFARGNQAFVFIGNNNAFSAAGQLRFNGGFVEGDVDGDLNADFRIQVNVASMVDTDFIL